MVAGQRKSTLTVKSSRFVFNPWSAHPTELALSILSQPPQPPFAPLADGCGVNPQSATVLHRFVKTCETDRLLPHVSAAQLQPREHRRPTELPHPRRKSSAPASVRRRISILQPKL